MPETIIDLGRKVKAKHPEYGDMSDIDVGRRVKAKYPTEYADFSDVSDQQSSLDAMKAKYAPLMEQPKDEGFLTGLGRTVNPVEMVRGVYKAVTSPIQTGRAVIQSQSEQFTKAGEALEQGHYSEALGHGVAGALPLIGPAAASAAEKIGEGRPGEGLGESTGLIATTVGPGMVARRVKASQPIAQKAASALKESALKTYGQVLNPTKQGTKFLSQKQVAPGLVERGVMAGTMKGLQSKTARKVAELGQKIGDEWDNLPAGTSVELEPIFNKLAQESDAAHTITVAGKKIPKGPEAVRAIANNESLQQTLMDVAEPNPTTGKLEIPVDRIRDLRQYWDDVAAKAGRFEGKQLADTSTAEAHALAANAIRNELSQQFPDIAKLNKEFNFWSNANKVVNETVMRREGQARPLGRTIMRAAGVGGGAAAGGPVGAILAGEAAALFERLATGPAWRTVSAVAKDRLAKAIAQGNTGKAGLIIRQMALGAGIGKRISEAVESTTPQGNALPATP